MTHVLGPMSTGARSRPTRSRLLACRPGATSGVTVVILRVPFLTRYFEPVSTMTILTLATLWRVLISMVCSPPMARGREKVPTKMRHREMSRTEPFPTEEGPSIHATSLLVSRRRGTKASLFRQIRVYGSTIKLTHIAGAPRPAPQVHETGTVLALSVTYVRGHALTAARRCLAPPRRGGKTSSAPLERARSL